MRRCLLLLVSLLWAPAAARGAEPAWPAYMTGYGLTADDAKANALKEVLARLNSALLQHDPPLTSWQPTLDFVRRHLVESQGKAGEEFNLEGLPPRLSWIYPLKPLDWPVLVALNDDARRLENRQERRVSGNHLFALGAVFLIAIFGYLRIEERAQGRYRARLRLAGVALLVALGGVWWALL